MKAYALYEINDLRYEETPIPQIGEDEVLLRVEAAGICGSDIPRIFYNGTYHFPTIPGHEFAGFVEKIGKNVDESLLGARCGAFPLIPCMECDCCKSKKYEMCKNYNYLGSRTDGGFAEYVKMPSWNLIRLPDQISYEEAAMLEPMAVAVHAMRSIAPKADETVVVCGLGTIGLFLTMFLKKEGIKNLYVIGNKEIQKNTALQLGISDENYIDCTKTDVDAWIMNATNGKGVDVFFECVGKNETMCQALNLTAPGGRIQMVGNPASNITFDQKTYWKLLRSQLTMKGSWNSSFTKEKTDDWHYVLDCIVEGKVHPKECISHSFDFTDLEKGLQIMKEKSEEYIKVMITK